MFCKPTLRRRHPRSNNRSSRSGIATVEFALCLPLMALICFGSIQVSSIITLRHKTAAILEVGTLDYMLGKVSESSLPEHIETLSEEFNLNGGTATVTQETINDVDYLRVNLSFPVAENLVAPMFIVSPETLSFQVLLYRP